MTPEQIGEYLEHNGASDEEIDEFLAHFGVKGMKWGVRKSYNKRTGELEKTSRNTASKLTVVAGGALGIAAANKFAERFNWTQSARTNALVGAVATGTVAWGGVVGARAARGMVDKYGKINAKELNLKGRTLGNDPANAKYTKNEKRALLGAVALGAVSAFAATKALSSNNAINYNS